MKILNKFRSTLENIKWENWKINSNHENLVPLYLIKGTTKTNKIPLVCAYAGDRKIFMNIWISYIFNEAQVFPIKKLPIHQIDKYLRLNNPQCSMIIYQHHGCNSIQAIKNKSFVIPTFIETILNTSEPIEQLSKKKKFGFTNTKRLITKYHLQYEIKDSKEAQQEFYHEMYLPYIKLRHGNKSRIVNFEGVFPEHIPFSIIFIKQNGQSIAGGVVLYREKRVSFAFLGIKNNVTTAVANSAIGAAYYFLRMEMHQKGIEKLHLGGSPPMLSEGLTRYKMRMLAQIDKTTPYKTSDLYSCMLIKDTKGIRDFLSTGPFVFENRNGKSACSLWVQADQYSDFDDFKKDIQHTSQLGFKSCHIIEWGNNLIPKSWLNQFDQEELIFQSANKYLNTKNSDIAWWLKEWKKRIKKARSIKHMDNYRKNYDELSFEKLVETANIWLHLYPEQASYDLPLVLKWMEKETPKPTFVLEIGGWRGDLAKSILQNNHAIQCWDNYDVISDASTQKCTDNRYQLIPLNDYIWNTIVDKKYNTLIATHMIEHLKWHELTQLIHWIPNNIQTVLFEAPIAHSAQNFNWKGHHSTHILEKGWKQIIEEMQSNHFVKIFSEKDTVIFNRVL